ncbi:PilZ domain-containing protein [Hydrocarboniclastica marina]|uniref:PilZ domain-containing protein n=1 Tax=Hydrocarboniclastica marina TaxID=2259620 RepID=A0A4P7XMH3_9ALTE|nr:PilZ domain-containing protein [Hydrocarboniclastica marina]MAL98393.1 pilus assembly protein PilZ [Alteromonadaceae bacterium]QCF27874.1 PilZ domain-containing protein [Hydrocarboniclastica marina]|tara:strand:- start:264 stop:521 length:258 start_codon:yes stop_codon:yes gene_type:complete
MTNRREFARTAMNASVKVCHPLIGEAIYKTRDISDGGIYVVAESDRYPPLGDHVQVQVQGLPVAAPTVTMEIVRHGGDGYGLQFV